MKRNLNDTSLDRVLGDLPSLFHFSDGTELDSVQDWPRLREELLERSVPLAFGQMPPIPEVFSTALLHDYGGKSPLCTYRITAGTARRTLSFELSIRFPIGEGPFPVVLTGDGCFPYLTDEIAREMLSRGFAVAIFNRTVLADDIDSYAQQGGLYDIYSSLKFGAVAAWAWGYHRCVDLLLRLPRIDPEGICITGHSRGGKATLLAAALDTRITYTQTNCSGLFGSGCFRYDQGEPCPMVGDHTHAERISNMMGREGDHPGFGYWINPQMGDYIGREQELPFDMHFLKAAVAPRYLLQSDSVDDVWADPRGAWQTYHAAKDLYAYLGVEDHIAAVYRYGNHFHTMRDFQVFLDYIEDARAGRKFLQDNADATYQLTRI